MTECLLDRPFAYLVSLGEDASRHSQLSIKGKQVFDWLLVVLSTHLHPKPLSTSYVSPFSPALLSSICDALRCARVGSPNEPNGTSVLPSVLSKLRDWRLVDPEYRYSLSGLHGLALDLAGIIDKPTASTSFDRHHISHARRRMKWVRSDSPSGSQSLPYRFGVVDKCTDGLSDLDECPSDTPFPVGSRLGTPDSEAGRAVASRRLHSVSGFRSGCSACRQPRMSTPSTPVSSQRATLEQQMPFGNLTQLETVVRPLRHPISTTVQHTPTEKRRRAKDKMSKSASRGTLRVDENEWPVARSTEVEQAISVSSPCQRTPRPHISNGIGSVTVGVQRPSSNAARSWSRQLPSWTRTHPTTATTPASCGNSTQSSPAKVNIQKSLLTWSRPSSAFKV